MANCEKEIPRNSFAGGTRFKYSKPDIFVSSPEISENKNHILYKIHGKDPEGPFEVTRRYKDFDLVRRALIKDWPGCYIPQIPPKQMIVIAT